MTYTSYIGAIATINSFLKMQLREVEKRQSVGSKEEAVHDKSPLVLTFKTSFTHAKHSTSIEEWIPLLGPYVIG